jgi:hypothetical protein
MEDFNIPRAERVTLLERLQAAMGSAPPYFCAACQVCDLKALASLSSRSWSCGLKHQINSEVYPEQAGLNDE